MAKGIWRASVAAAAVLFSAGAAEAKVKNVIIMIADGAGYNTLQATRLFKGSGLAVDSLGFQKTSISTYPLRTGTTPIPGAAGLAQDPNTVYSSAKNWDTTPVAGSAGGYPRGFEGYEWNRRTAPDSANTIAAVMTGQKTYNNAVNVDGNGNPLTTVAEYAVQGGRRAGVVSNVQFSDATPAVGGGAHNVSRANRQAIAQEMFSAGVLSVIGGAGNPDYNDNGELRATPDNSWVSPTLWNDLKTGSNVSGANADPWTLLQDRAAIEAVANGSQAAPDKLAMIIKAFNGAQQYRGGLTSGTEDPFATPLLDSTPSTSVLTLAALANLSQDPDGFYLLAENGTVDRAMHANNLGRTIEAYLEFDQAVSDVVSWVDRADTDADWSNTLLIVSADHDHLLFGPDAATNPFQAVQADGADAGLLPEHSWLSGSHSNQLVPLFAKGVGANQILGLADEIDFYQDQPGRTFGYGAYTDQAELGQFLIGAVNGTTAVPEPATWAMMIGGFSLMGSALRRARRQTIRFA